MAISNKRYFLFFRGLLLMLLAVIFIDITLSQLSGSIGDFFSNHIPAIISILIILVLATIRVNYFSYEDEYEIIHIRSRSLIFGRFESMSRTRYEFPKRIVQKVEMQKFLFQKQLILHLKTQKGEKKIHKFDLSFLPMKKLTAVFQSLQKISEQNTTARTV